MGHFHAMYNASDKPVEWMNINASARKDTYDGFDLGDDRRGTPSTRCRYSGPCAWIVRCSVPWTM